VKRTLCSVALAIGVATGGAPMTPVALAAETQATQMSPGLESILGKEVTTLREGDGGRVIDVLVDGHGRIRAAVVEFGGFLGIGTRKIAVDWAAFRFAGKSIWVDVTRDQLRSAVEYKTSEPPFILQSISSDY
jgi:PRC-barrel domain